MNVVLILKAKRHVFSASLPENVNTSFSWTNDIPSACQSTMVECPPWKFHDIIGVADMLTWILTFNVSVAHWHVSKSIKEKSSNVAGTWRRKIRDSLWGEKLFVWESGATLETCRKRSLGSHKWGLGVAVNLPSVWRTLWCMRVFRQPWEIRLVTTLLNLHVFLCFQLSYTKNSLIMVLSMSQRHRWRLGLIRSVLRPN